MDTLDRQNPESEGKEMMNKSKIEWCDFTWNPVTGCLNGCPYCYAAKQAKRFCGNIKINKASGQMKEEHGLWTLEKPFRNEIDKVTPFPVGFQPALHEYRLPMPAQKKKPAIIFVVSMGDLFGNWVPDAWIERVFEAAKAAPWHTYLFLTKNPQRYMDLAAAGKLPEYNNFWYGSTVTTPDDAFWWSEHHNTYVSIEPIMKPFDMPEGEPVKKVGWVIVGAETGQQKNKTAPQPEWIQTIIDEARKTATPIFLKDNLKPHWPGELIQEFPEFPNMHKSGDNGK